MVNFLLRGQVRLGRGFLLAVLFLLTLVSLGGCAQDMGGNLTLKSVLPDGARLTSGFGTGIYRYEDQNHLILILLNGPAEHPKEILTIRLLWAPTAGQTPIDATATNATIHYVIFSGDQGQEVGVYSGSGFVFLRNTPGQPHLRASVWQATLKMSDRTAGFTDLLGPATLQGDITAERDDLPTQRMLRQLDSLVTQRLGYPRMVQLPGTSFASPFCGIDKFVFARYCAAGF